MDLAFIEPRQLLLPQLPTKDFERCSLRQLAPELDPPRHLVGGERSQPSQIVSSVTSGLFQ